MSGSAMFVQPPNSIPIPMLADLNGQCYYVAGGLTRYVTFSPVLAGGSYAAGQSIGPIQNVSGFSRAVGVGSGIILGATIVDPNRNIGQVDIFFFNPGVGNPPTDKTEFVLNSADAGLVAGVQHITDWTVYGAAAGCSVGQVTNSGIIFRCGATGGVVGSTLQIVLVARAALTLPVGGYSVSIRVLPD